MFNKIILIIALSIPLHAYSGLDIQTIEKDFNFRNDTMYLKSIDTLRYSLSDHNNSYGKYVYISEKENKIYKMKINADKNNNTYIHLVFNARNAYMLGFITSNKENNIIKEKYYRFNEDKKSDLIDINNITTFTLPFSGNYTDLERKSTPREKMITNMSSVETAVTILSKHHENKKYDDKTSADLKKSMLQLILLTSESVRFPPIRKWNSEHLKHVNTNTTFFGLEYKKLTNDWSMISSDFKKIYGSHSNNRFNYSFKFGNMMDHPQPYNSTNIHNLCDYANYIPDTPKRDNELSEKSHKLYYIDILGERTYFPENQFMYINYAMTYYY